MTRIKASISCCFVWFPGIVFVFQQMLGSMDILLLGGLGIPGDRLIFMVFAKTGFAQPSSIRFRINLLSAPTTQLNNAGGCLLPGFDSGSESTMFLSEK